MLKRQISYLMLVGFAAVMVVLLMLDDPTTRQAMFAQVQAAQQSQRVVGLFPELESLDQIYAIQVLDIASGKDVLLMRNEDGAWYAPGLAVEDTDQVLAETAAYSIALMAAQQRYDATPENLEIFGFEPQPSYQIQFAARDTAGVSYAPVTLEVGDVNPDNVSYYVWPVDDSRIYLIPKLIMDPLLSVVTESIQITPTPVSEVTAPVP